MQRRAVVRAGACALVALAGPPRFLVRAAAAAQARGKVLVAVFQRGAVDGLAMVPPHPHPPYPRPPPPPRAGPPPRPLGRGGALAAAHGGGSPDATRSHFDAQDYMETGTPGVK